MEKIIIKGRGVMPGKAEGIAMVCPDSIEGYGGFNPKTGEIVEHNHIHKGESLSGTIFVLPGSRGSNGWSCFFGAARAAGAGPKALIFNRIDSSSGVAIAISKVPAVVDFPEDQNPCEFIRDGDHVIVDGDSGTIEITRK
jgi:hypothetical protein